VEMDPVRSRLDAVLSKCWWKLQPADEQAGRGSPPWEMTVLSRRNLATWALITGWALYYFTFQFHTSQNPNYPDGFLFSTEPNLWLQEHRHIVLDYFLSYSWVILFVSVVAVYLLAALASGREFYRFGLAFFIAWIIQYTLQLTVNMASPMRDPGSELEFIRHEVFPFSENFVGIKYGAFPSGHAGVTFLLCLLGRERRLSWVAKFASSSLVLLIISVLYLGEHYLIDVVASLVMYPVIFYGTLRLIPAPAGDARNGRQNGRETEKERTRSGEAEPT